MCMRYMSGAGAADRLKTRRMGDDDERVGEQITIFYY